MGWFRHTHACLYTHILFDVQEATIVKTDENQEVYPFSDSRAAQMLRHAFQRAHAERRLSIRSIAKILGYKQATVLSHMANGRIAVPLERATEIARAVELPPADFLIAALEQRNPDAADLMSGVDGLARQPHDFAFEMRAIAGVDIDQLSVEQKAVLREVVNEPHPGRRWVSLAELPTILALRDAWPGFGEGGLPRGVLNEVARLVRAHRH